VFTRPFVATAVTATTVFVGSTAGGVQIVPSNALRVALTVQPLSDAFRVGPLGSMTASSGLLIASGVIQVMPLHSGPHFALPNGGATAAIAIWESQS
jgi:hypothetical protein